ncbi:intracellular proteinase inhibitor [Bacillus sp. JCM 19046]|nr:intracellular proteinase inhibitor [Bacillus sp. JCM 19045]GAF19393.1 intracellular proteinase inhibitor [Bacillus sp. JCM 19046]
MKAWKLYVASLFLFTLVACGGQPEDEEDPNIPTGGDSTVEEPWLFNVDYQIVDDHLNVDMYVENNTDDVQTLVFTSGQMFEITLVNSEDEEVYRFSDDQMFTQSIQKRNYEAGETADFRESIPLENIAAGTYMMTVELTVSEETKNVSDNPSAFTRSVEVEISQTEE